MKILKLEVEGLPIFKEKISINFMPVQRVNNENAEKMYELFSSNSQTYYKNNILSFIGINASGKTTILKLITFIFHMLNNEPIHNIKCEDIFEGLKENQCVIFKTYFYTEKNIQINIQKNGVINCLETVIKKVEKKADSKYIIVKEYLKSKPITKAKNKESIFDFNNIEINLSRNINADFLMDDVSIMVAFNKKNKEHIYFADLLQHTNVNQIEIDNECPPELITFLDPSIEYLKINNLKLETEIKLKFKNKEELILTKLADLNNYLSSGTIKGINTYLKAFETFKNGGYLIIDELENHFNQEIVSTLLRFYMDKKINYKGASLIFSTHFAEILDEFERNDNIYIVYNDLGICTKNFSNMLYRNDLKKSEVYKSGYFNWTTPNYDSYIDLKKYILSSNREEY